MADGDDNRCVDCGFGGDGALLHFCDMTANGPWCGECFQKIECFEKHGEGCETIVVGFRDPLPDTKSVNDT